MTDRTAPAVPAPAMCPVHPECYWPCFECEDADDHAERRIARAEAHRNGDL